MNVKHITESSKYIKLFKSYRNKVVYEIRYKYYLFIVGKKYYSLNSEQTEKSFDECVNIAKGLYKDRDYINLGSYMKNNQMALKLINIGYDLMSEDLYIEQQAQIFASQDVIN